MFVETKKEGEIVQAVPSMASFIAWLKTKNPNETYPYMNCDGGCLIGQYVNAIGLSWTARCSGPGWGGISVGGKFTFGAALKRARAVQAVGVTERG